ncbi:hypothetical protein OE88DRAFT_1655574, partial [Heliocybe sulcata]
MATNVQQLPSWMTYSTTVITDAAGDPIATSTTILTLPLTYYGPSVSSVLTSLPWDCWAQAVKSHQGHEL